MNLGATNRKVGAESRDFNFFGFWDLAVGQNPVPLANMKIDGTWVFIRPKME